MDYLNSILERKRADLKKLLPLEENYGPPPSSGTTTRDSAPRWTLGKPASP